MEAVKNINFQPECIKNVIFDVLFSLEKESLYPK